MVWLTQLAERWSSLTGGFRIEAFISLALLAHVGFTYKKNKTKDVTGFTPYVVAYFLVLLLQVVNSWDSDYSWFIFVERVLKYSAMALFILHYVNTPKKLKYFVFVWMLASFKILSEGVVGGITGSLVWQNQGVMRLHGSTGLYGHPNSLSQFAIGVIPFIYYLYPLFKSNKWIKYSLIIMLASSIFCIIGTNSRTGFLGAIFLILFIFWKSHAKAKIKIIFFTLLIILPIATIFTPEETKGRFATIFGGKEAEGSSKEGRIKMYGQGWYIFTEHPFGLGIGNYRLANHKYFNFSQEVHNLFLEVLTHLGIQGFIVFTLLLFKIRAVLNTTINRCNGAYKHNQSLSFDMSFVKAISQALVAFLYLRLFFGLFSMDVYSINWWFIIGTASALFYLQNNIKDEGILK